MPQDSSFDIISEINLQELDNAVNQAVKELRTRFDFKGSKSSIELMKTEKKIQLIGDDELKLRNLQDMLKTRMAARRIPLQALEFKTPEKAFEGTLRQEVTWLEGIPADKAKEIIRVVREFSKKVQASIQGTQVRVASKSKDELQAVIGHLKAQSFNIPLQFTNYR